MQYATIAKIPYLCYSPSTTSKVHCIPPHFLWIGCSLLPFMERARWLLFLNGFLFFNYSLLIIH